MGSFATLVITSWQTFRYPLAGWLLMVCGALQDVYGQTRHYLEGHKTGRTSSVILVSSASLSSPMSPPTLTTPFYYADSNQLTGTTTNASTAEVRSLLDVAGLLSADAYIQFRNTSNQYIPGGTTTYITLNEAPNFNGLLSVPLSQQEFIIGTGFSGAGDYVLGGLFGPSANENVGTVIPSTVTELLVDGQGRWYAGITPPDDYNSVRLTIQSGDALIGAGNGISVNIHNAFTQEIGDKCSVLGKFTTPGETTGINVNLLNLNEAIANAHHVLLDNSQYAAYSSGVLGLGVANSISQTIVFDHKATINDGINIKLGLSNSLIGLDVLNSEAVSVSAYNGPGGSPVWEADLQEIGSLLGLDLLDLINLDGSHQNLEFTIKPGVVFDRIKIQFNPGLITLDVIGDALRVFHVKLLPETPEITTHPKSQVVCAGDEVTFSVSTTPTSIVTGYQWQYFDGTTWVNVLDSESLPTYTIPNIPVEQNGRQYRVAVTGGQSGCEQTVFSAIADLVVNNTPGRPDINIANSSN